MVTGDENRPTSVTVPAKTGRPLRHELAYQAVSSARPTFDIDPYAIARLVVGTDVAPRQMPAME